MCTMWFKNVPVARRDYLSVAFILLLFWSSAQNSDYRILHSLNKGEKPAWDRSMKNLSFSVYVLEPIPPVAISLQGYFTKDKEMLWNGYKSAISLCTALAVSTGLKYSLDRQRPYQKYPGEIIARDKT